MAKAGNTVGTKDDTKRNTTTITGGGGKPDIINNVYDLYGCHYEWTLEAYDTEDRVKRGGAYEISYPLAKRYGYYPGNTMPFNSSRATLYIK